MSSQPIEIIELAPQRAVTVRRTVPQTGLGGFFMEIFPKLRGAIRAQGATPAGPPFARYYNGDPSAFDTEAGIPFTGSFMITDEEIRVTKLPAGIGVVLAGSNFGPEPTHQVPCSTTM